MLARPEASAELTSPCAAAAAGTLQEVPGPSVLCDEIPWRLTCCRGTLLDLYISYKQRATYLEHLRLCKSQSVSTHWTAMVA